MGLDDVPEDVTFFGIKLVNTCVSSPEQYDAYDKDGKVVGYFRLRWGRLRVEWPKCGGEVVFEAPISPVRYEEHYKMYMGWAGNFQDSKQREVLLETGCLALYNKIKDPKEKRYI